MPFARRRSTKQAKIIKTTFPSSVNHILDGIMRNQPIQTTLQSILRLGLALTQSPEELAFLRIADYETGRTKYRVTVNETHAESILDDMRGITGRAMRTKTIQRVPDVRADRDFVTLADGVRSEIALPVLVGDQLLGVMNFESPQKDWFTEDDALWLEVLAYLAGAAAAIEDDRALKETDLALGKHQQDYQFERDMDALLDQVIALFPAEDLMAEVLLEVLGSEQLITLRIRPDESLALYIRLHKGEGIAGQVFASGQPRAGTIDRSDADERGRGTSGDVAHLFNTKSSLVYPLTTEGKVIGVLNIESPSPETFTRESVQRLQQSGLAAKISARIAAVQRERIPEADIAEDLLDKFRRDVFMAQNPNDQTGIYYQILQVAAQMINAPDISGGLILVRKEPHWDDPDPAVTEERQLWMVRAARIGAFDSPREWQLEGKSIARRIIRNRKGEVINDARADPDYKSSLSTAAETSELIVPLLDGANPPLGVIGLDSPRKNTFTSADLRNIEKLAELAVQVIKRGETFARGRRAAEQLDCVRVLQLHLAKLFPKDIRQLRAVDINQIRQQIFDQVLAWALVKTESDYAALVLPEASRGEGAPEQDIPEQIVPGEGTPGQIMLRLHKFLPASLPIERQLWPSTEGVSGEAYQSGIRQDVGDTIEAKAKDPTGYLDVFPHARSEIAVPMKRGREVIGVLDFESTREHHYSVEMGEWADFLALQCAFAMSVIESSEKTKIDLTLSELNRQIDVLLNRFPDIPLTAVRGERDQMLKALLETYRQISGAEIGRILLAQNAYHWGTERLDLANGIMHYMVSTIPSETEPGAKRYFTFARGATVAAFRTKRMIYFNNLRSRPPEFFSMVSPDIESGLFIPLYEGATVVGVMDVESRTPNVFTPTAIAGGEKVAAMASKLIVATRLQLRREEAQLQRNFELEILQNRFTHAKAYMERILTFAMRLADIKEGWGRVVLVRRSEDERFFEEESVYTYDLTGADAAPPVVGVTSAKHTPIEFSVYKRALTEKRPILVTDTTELMHPMDLHLIGLPEAKSLICVPLLRAKDSADQATLSVSTMLQAKDLIADGVLFLASPRPAEFSEADKYTLTTLAQTTVIGLNNLALHAAGKELMERVRHNFVNATFPFEVALSQLEKPFSQAAKVDDPREAQQLARKAYEYFAEFRDTSNLIAKLMHWFFDLVDSSRFVEDKDAPMVEASTFKEKLDHPFSTLAKYVHEDITISWSVSPGLKLRGGEKREDLISAVLFNYVDNAVKYATSAEISINIHPGGPDEDTIVFEVSNGGDAIDEIDQHMLFQLHFRANSDDTISGSGIGLYQVKEIADQLHGKPGYRYDEGEGENVFSLTVPRV